MSIFNKICKEVSPSNPEVHPNQSVTIYVPVATDSILGIAKFYSDHFVVVDGQVKLKGAWESILTAISDVNNAKEEANNAADRADTSVAAAQAWANLYGYNADGTVNDDSEQKSAKYWAEKASELKTKLYKHSVEITYENSEGTWSFDAYGILYNTSPELIDSVTDIKDNISAFNIVSVMVDGYDRIPHSLTYNTRYGIYVRYLTAISVDANGVLYLTKSSKNSKTPTITDTVKEV